jgi:hypothetical protein
MGALNTYLQATQNFLRDTQQRLEDPGTLVNYINRARREVAMRSECIRIVPPISGPIVSTTIVDGGSGYTAPTVAVSTPDSPGGTVNNPAGAQATATVTQTGGVIDNVYITYGGDGYFAPTITISDPTGTGADVTAETVPVLTANYAQEVYPFSVVDLSEYPGVGSIYAVRSVSFLYANTRYSALVYSFSQYQAKIRQFGPGMYYYVPVMGAQFGRGEAGSFYLYPPPSQSLQMEWDWLVPAVRSDRGQRLRANPRPVHRRGAVLGGAFGLSGASKLQRRPALRGDVRETYSAIWRLHLARPGDITIRAAVNGAGAAATGTARRAAATRGVRGVFGA